MTENIYNTPNAELNSQENDGKTKRPKLVWVIFIFACIGLLGIPEIFLFAHGAIPIKGPVKEYYENLGTFDYALMLIGAIYNFVCALQLFRLKKVALYLYMGSILLSIFSALYNFNNENFMRFLNAQGTNVYVDLLPGFIFLALIVAYAYYLNKKGILKP